MLISIALSGYLVLILSFAKCEVSRSCRVIVWEAKWNFSLVSNYLTDKKLKKNNVSGNLSTGIQQMEKHLSKQMF